MQEIQLRSLLIISALNSKVWGGVSQERSALRQLATQISLGSIDLILWLILESREIEDTHRMGVYKYHR